jgi:hypothetical protein
MLLQHPPHAQPVNGKGPGNLSNAETLCRMQCPDFPLAATEARLGEVLKAAFVIRLSALYFLGSPVPAPAPDGLGGHHGLVVDDGKALGPKPSFPKSLDGQVLRAAEPQVGAGGTSAGFGEPFAWPGGTFVA